MKNKLKSLGLAIGTLVALFNLQTSSASAEEYPFTKFQTEDRRYEETFSQETNATSSVKTEVITEEFSKDRYINNAPPITKKLIQSKDPNVKLSEQEMEQFLKELDSGVARNIYNVYDDWNTLTPAEKSLAKTNPWVAARVKICKDIAWNITGSRYGQGYNDWRDAFRHGLWNAVMVRDVGPNWAKKWADAHETIAGQPAIEKQMDLFNNAVGRTLSKYGSSANNTTIANNVKKYIDQHKFKRISRDKRSLVWTP
ncbi:DUF6973 domain-containing protein [Bacillus pseudomycoides]|uniref:DUF6973 domain-containing protein n=1 Tax=Bacillus pseudomycoides TaxID=64104 RepID=UPI000BEBD789|nr:hypothetical protein [Bacillus pseudomycoides]PEB39359.1 hypothetical protein COO06_23515 [Bacillus pseudomycoides]PGD95750.1 hypothetical protein COM50_15035 [Bacillus pseudomycoides]PGD97760.1 hypothetical protein COM49_24310 [Bacillus pseudomycoides]PHE65754.1 hypothetical protein COF69_22150 [Bacillus pseudomycoides]PHG17078.1 hypothetical protein COI47_24200 [Bacillus pseudomycoides]